MKIVIPGGTGNVGAVLERGLLAAGHRLTVLTRSPSRPHHLHWDGRTVGPWAEAIDGADAVINLAGRSVNCRYTPENLVAMMDSRVDSTRVVGEAKGPKINASVYKNKTNSRRHWGHRQHYTTIEITGISKG